MDMAIGLLLQTRMPKWRAATLGLGNYDSAPVDPDEFAVLERNVLLISRHVGLLSVRAHHAKSSRWYADEAHQESLERWIRLAGSIQAMFDPADESKKPSRGAPGPHEEVVGKLGVIVAWRELPSLSIRPETTHDALVYHAAQMIAAGTKFHTCKHCRAPFLGGGAGHGRNKKRADAHFCSDACRWGYHNASRRKTRSKSKS
jgi:hypothetical protein